MNFRYLIDQWRVSVAKVVAAINHLVASEMVDP